jgi:acetylornithine deacetylase/succinyl-diaminopimelate desuccinylase-like protein
VFASLDVPSPRGSITLYIHYDGQPVNAAEWTRCKPFAPCLYSATGPVSLDASITTFDPQWRVYGRSAADDKAPIIATLNAVEALRAIGSAPAWNLRVVLDGEEEAGSANFRRFATARADALKSDLAITLDGPRHPSGRPTLYFGVRGGAGLTVTVYGAKNDLHSGNYGNWAPDPSMRLAKLLATMKDDTGRVVIDHFYDDVTALTPTEVRALEDAPNVEAALKKDFSVVMPERAEQRLERKLNEPTLSILAMESGGGLRAPARSAIPASAAARIEMRLVHGLDPQKQNALVVAHIRKQGYFVVEGRDPSDQERVTHQLIARVDPRGGSTAPKVSMDDPMAKALMSTLSKLGRPLVRLPTLGGSMPFATFSDRMPTVGFSIVNHDNNQHGPDENLRLQNLWEGIEMLAAIMRMER